jgi:hypothetical protein
LESSATKAATPVPGRVDIQSAFADVRPGAVVDEMSCSADGDVNVQAVAAIKELSSRVGAGCSGRPRQKGSCGLVVQTGGEM